MKHTYYGSADIRPQGAWYPVRLETQKTGKAPCIDVHKLADILPHGSGIDAGWTINVKHNGDITVYGEYHAMNDGGYTEWRNFRFSLRRAVKNEYRPLSGPLQGKYQVTKVKGTVYLCSFVGGGDAGDYLYDVVSCALSDGIGVWAMDSHIVDSKEQAKMMKFQDGLIEFWGDLR